MPTKILKKPAAVIIDKQSEEEEEEEVAEAEEELPGSPSIAAVGQGSSDHTKRPKIKIEGSPLKVVESPPPVAARAMKIVESPATAAARAMHVTTVSSSPAPKAITNAIASPSLVRAFDNSPGLRQAEIPSVPDKLRVQYEPPERDGSAFPLNKGLVRLRRSGQLCDAAVVAIGGTIRVHRVVLAAHSEVLDGQLQGADAELNLQSTSQEAADLLVRWLYGEVIAEEYQPSCMSVNEEVLRLASKLALPMLSDLCTMRLAANVNTENVVASVRLCEELGLDKLRSALVTALYEDGRALNIVAQDPATLDHPVLMRELLTTIAMNVGTSRPKTDSPPTGGSGKRRRKA